MERSVVTNRHVSTDTRRFCIRQVSEPALCARHTYTHTHTHKHTHKHTHTHTHTHTHKQTTHTHTHTQTHTPTHTHTHTQRMHTHTHTHTQHTTHTHTHTHTHTPHTHTLLSPNYQIHNRRLTPQPDSLQHLSRTTIIFSSSLQGADSQSDCFVKCTADAKCKYVTFADSGWCFNAQYCNTTNPFSGAEPLLHVHTYQRASRSKRSPTERHIESKHVRTDQRGEDETLASPPPPTPATSTLAGVRELASLSSPWFFSAVPESNATAYASSWLTAFDPDGLGGPYGLRTAEKRAKGYFCGHGCCSWSGPMWPFETSKVTTSGPISTD
jgi:hypothetical protein